MSDVVFPLVLSLQVAACATAATAVVGTALAYLLARRDFRGRQLLDTAVSLPMVLPPVVTGYLLVLLVGRSGALGRALEASAGVSLNLMFTWQAAVLAAFVVSLPLVVRSARAAIESVDRELVEASRTLGRSELATAWHVVLPLARRGIAAGVVLAFARALGEFGATMMVAGNIPGRTNTMALEIYTAALYGDGSRATLLVLVFLGASAAMMLAADRLSRAVAR